MEAATSRLEDLTAYQADALKAISCQPGPASSAAKETSPTSTSTPSAAKPKAASSAEPKTATSAPAPAAASTPKSIVEYDAFLKEAATPFLALSKELGGPVSEQAQDIELALNNTRNLLLIATEAKKPSDDDAALAGFYKEIFTHLQAVVAIKDAKENRSSKLYNHIATVADGVSAFSWFTVPTPASFIGDFKDSAQFFANKVLKEFRGVDQKHVDWVQSFIQLLTKLQAYVKQYQTTGPAWNTQGKDFAQVAAKFKSGSSPSSSSSAPPPPAAAAGPGGPPPPPPPPSAADLMKESPTQSSSSSGMGAVFEQLNQGSAVTSHLKKVDKSQMTHKNPELRKSSTVQSGSHKPVPPKKPASLSHKKEQQVAKRPARKELVDNKWVIENFENDSSIIIEVELSHAVIIDRCVNSTIQIKGKANALTINSCTGCGVLLDTLVSGVDIIKCTKFGIQVTGKVHTISVDQSDVGQIYLSKDSINMEIYTSQSTALNIEVPKEDDGDFDEVAVPEQLMHKVGPNGKLISTIVEHAG